MNKFQKNLLKTQRKNDSLVCVGLDSDFEKIPKHLLKKKDPIFEFNKRVINATHDLVCAYKPNIAFYEAKGEEGIATLVKTTDYIHSKYPDIPVILDAKKGDIGNANLAYIRLIFDYLKADAVTLHPYFGIESLFPFLSLKNKFFFILCRTSNPGAGEFQDLVVNHPDLGKVPLYQVVAYQVARKWNTNGNCCLVVGATYPEELAQVRKIAPDLPFLIPGIGKQGGDVEKTVTAGRDREGRGMIINSSRGIIFASGGTDFAQAARNETEKLRKMINQYRES